MDNAKVAAMLRKELNLSDEVNDVTVLKCTKGTLLRAQVEFTLIMEEIKELLKDILRMEKK